MSSRSRSFGNAVLPAMVLCGALCGATGAARAADRESSTVVVVFEPQAQAISRRLRQELEALGLKVALESEVAPPASLEQLALNAGAVAAIRVQPRAEGGVEMTVLDRATGKTVRRDLLRVDARDAAAEELIATRTVELLRASLLELSADHPPRGALSVAPPVAAVALREQAQGVRRRSGEVFVAAGPALLLMPGWRASWQLTLGMGWLSSAGLGVTAALDSPLAPAHATHREGSVDTRATSYRLGGLWQLGASSDSVSLRVGAGWSLISLAVRGTASAPFASAQTDFLVSAPWLSVSARLRLSSHWAIWLQTSGEWAVPRATVRIAGREVEDLARPAWLGAFGPELRWP